MRYDPRFIALDVHCPSPAEADRLQELLRQRSGPDAVMIVKRMADTLEEIPYRMGDYFTEILILPAVARDPCTFRFVFHRHPQAGRFWKDLMVRLIRFVETAGHDVTVTMIYKGDICLDWQHWTPEGINPKH